MKNKRLLNLFGEIDETYIAEAAQTISRSRSRSKSPWRKWGTIAACVVLLVSACFGSVAVVSEAREYEAAVQFFQEHHLSTQGLTRHEIKAVCRDIITQSFTYSKTAEVLQNRISSDNVDGYEITQETLTPEDVEKLWNYKNTVKQGVHYKTREAFQEDPELGFDVFDKSYLEKYDGESLVWCVEEPDFWIEDYAIVSDGVIAYGRFDRWSSKQISHAWLSKIDTDGNLIWKQELRNGFHTEYISNVLENADGSYAVFSRGDYEKLCLSQYTADGERIHFSQTDVGNYGIWNVVPFEKGYIVQLGSYTSNEYAKIVKVDRDGTLTDSFSYSGKDAYYYITDMIEFQGNIYLSAYAIPKSKDEDDHSGGQHAEIASVVEYLFDKELFEISSDELTPMVRNNYTAILLVCEPNAGIPQEFYSVKGSLGGKLSANDIGDLVWDVESIATTFFSPYTSAFTIGGTSSVYRYTFDESGVLVNKEKTDEVIRFSR